MRAVSARIAVESLRSTLNSRALSVKVGANASPRMAVTKAPPRNPKGGSPVPREPPPARDRPEPRVVDAGRGGGGRGGIVEVDVEQQGVEREGRRERIAAHGGDEGAAAEPEGQRAGHAQLGLELGRVR